MIKDSALFCLIIAFLSNIFSYVLAVLPEPMYITSIVLYMCYITNLVIAICIIVKNWKG